MKKLVYSMIECLVEDKIYRAEQEGVQLEETVWIDSEELFKVLGLEMNNEEDFFELLGNLPNILEELFDEGKINIDYNEFDEQQISLG